MKSKIIIVLAVIGAVAALAAIVYAIYRYFTPDYLDDFDDDFEFTKGMGQNFEMIGNAVPPLFAKKLAESVYELHCKYTKTED